MKYIILFLSLFIFNFSCSGRHKSKLVKLDGITNKALTNEDFVHIVSSYSNYNIEEKKSAIVFVLNYYQMTHDKKCLDWIEEKERENDPEIVGLIQIARETHSIP